MSEKSIVIKATNNMNNPKVSIIIATYNAESTIRAALDSVCQVVGGDIECLIVDGNSKDNTVSIVEEYEQKYPNIRHLSEPDNGIYDAFNKGWKLAKGEWVYYLGADDVLLPEGLGELLSVENIANYGIVYGNIITKNEKGETRVSKSKSVNVLPNQFFGSHQSLIMRKSLIEDLNGFDTNIKLLADKDLIIRAFLCGQCLFKQVQTEVAIFYDGGASSSIINPIKDNYKIYRKNRLPLTFILYVVKNYSIRFIQQALKKTR